MVLNFNCTLILLSMCRNIISLIRSNLKVRLKYVHRHAFLSDCEFICLHVNRYSQNSLMRTPKGHNQVPALQRCLYYIEVANVCNDFWHFWDQTNCP